MGSLILPFVLFLRRETTTSLMGSISLTAIASSMPPLATRQVPLTVSARVAAVCFLFLGLLVDILISLCLCCLCLPVLHFHRIVVLNRGVTDILSDDITGAAPFASDAQQDEYGAKGEEYLSKCSCVAVLLPECTSVCFCGCLFCSGLHSG